MYALAHTAHAKEYLNIKTKRTYMVLCAFFSPLSAKSSLQVCSFQLFAPQLLSIRVPAVVKPAALCTPCPQITPDAQTRVQKDLGDAGEGTLSQHPPPQQTKKGGCPKTRNFVAFRLTYIYLKRKKKKRTCIYIVKPVHKTALEKLKWESRFSSQTPAVRRMKAKGCKPWMCLTSDGNGRKYSRSEPLPQIRQHGNMNFALNPATESSPWEAATPGSAGDAQAGPPLGRIIEGGGRGDAVTGGHRTQELRTEGALPKFCPASGCSGEPGAHRHLDFATFLLQTQL